MLHLKKKYHMCLCVCYYGGMLKQFNDTFYTHAENNINSLVYSQPQIPSKEARASFCPFKTIRIKKRHSKMKE